MILLKPASTFRDHALEPIIDARAHHIHLHTGAIRQRRRTRHHDRVIHCAQIDIEVFEPGAPVRTERKFGAGAEGPAAWSCILGDRGAQAARGRRALERDAPDRIAAGDISEPTVRRITDARARRAKPVHVMFERRRDGRRTERTLRGYAAFGAAPIKIAFGAKNERAGLPIEPSLPASNGAEHGSVGARERHPAEVKTALIARQSQPTISANIEAAPVGNGAIGWRRRVYGGAGNRRW